MNIKNIIDSHIEYGTTPTDILKRYGYSKILENVIIAPWWSFSIFKDYSDKIEQVGEKVYNIYGKEFAFSFIEVKNIGAPAILETVLPLGLTKCKRIIFIGSVGSLTQNIKIGDLVIPKFSYNGVGACRFLNDKLKDDFETKVHSNSDLNEKILAVLLADFPQYAVHQTINYSVDTIFAQFPHIGHFIDLGCQSVEMETSSFFKCGEITNIQTSALLCVSDNTIKKKSLYTGRNVQELKIKKEIRDKVIPQIIIKVLQSL